MLLHIPAHTLEMNLPIVSHLDFRIPNHKTRSLGTVRCTSNDPSNPLLSTLLHLHRLASILPWDAHEDNPFNADISHALQVRRREFSLGAQGGRAEGLLREGELSVDICAGGIIVTFPIVDIQFALGRALHVNLILAVGSTSLERVMKRVYGSRVMRPLDPRMRSFRGMIWPPCTNNGILPSGAGTLCVPLPLYVVKSK